MVQFDNQYRQIKLKIVYYGPALGGKTTCLRHVHRVTDPEQRTRLYSLNTASDRTLFFDLLSLSLGRIRGYRLAVQLYTVPGQVQYNATRRAVLSGADGVVFVADSQPDQRGANLQSLENLAENLEANGLDPGTIPLVILLNKRDLDQAMSVAEMEAALNPRGVPCFPGVATTGVGVMEGFAEIAERTLTAASEKLGVGSNQLAVRRLQEQVRATLTPFVAPGGGAPDGDEELAVTRAELPTPAEQPLVHDSLVSEAVRANLAMTDLSSRLDGLRRQLERKVRVLASIAEFGRSVASERDPLAILRLLIQTTVRQLRVQAATVMVVPGSGELREVLLHGLKRDPLLGTADEAGEPLALGLLGGRRARLLNGEGEGDGDAYLMAAVEGAGYRSALAVPLETQERLVGLLTCYADGGRITLDDDDLQLASVLGGTSAMAYGTALAWKRLEELNRGLEAQVEARTREVRQSLVEVERLAGDLADKNRLVEDAYRELAELDRVKSELVTRISHELRNPVASIQSAARVLEQYRDGPPEKTARFVSLIREETTKLAEIVDSVVQGSVLAAASDLPARRPIPAEELFRQVVAPLRDLAQEREVRLQVRIQAGLDSVFCDPPPMEAALRALVKNAIEFSYSGDSVQVEARRQHRGETPWIVLQVRDTGVGIPEQELPLVFDTFWQGGNVLAGRRRGLGLGLAIVKRVVENHGGKVRVASRVAEGTEVTVELPQEGAG